MKRTTGLTNVQNISGDTDFEERPHGEEDRVHEKDNRQMPSDAVITPIKDPLYEKDKKPMIENSREPQRIMKARTSYERRIF